MRRATILFTILALAGCGPDTNDAGHGHGHGEADSWAVTAWGEVYELFPEFDALAAGHEAESHVHVTVLEGFAPLTEGRVAILLTEPGGKTLTFEGDTPLRDGIYRIAIRPEREGEHRLAFRIESPAGIETMPGGAVRVGPPDDPGGLVRSPHEAPLAGDQAVSFLKEQQWRTEFATAWVKEAALGESVEGPARVRPRRRGRGRAHRRSRRHRRVFSLAPPRARPRRGRHGVPARAPGRGPQPARAARRGPVARSRGRRGAAARRAPDRAAGGRGHESGRAGEGPRHGWPGSRPGSPPREGAFRRTGRHGGASAPATVAVEAPWAGRVAEVTVSPGQTVAAGAPLGPPREGPAALDRRRLASRGRDPRPVFAPGPLPQALRTTVPQSRSARRAFASSHDRPRSIPVRPRSTSSSRSTAAPPSCRSAAPVEAELVLPGERRGVVVPLSAVLDDSGTSVAYVQLDGESFARREIRVLGRLGNEALVDGLRARRAARHAGRGRRAAQLAPLHRRPRRPRPLRGGECSTE